jgi:hypothetical protein
VAGRRGSTGGITVPKRSRAHPTNLRFVGSTSHRAAAVRDEGAAGEGDPEFAVVAAEDLPNGEDRVQFIRRRVREGEFGVPEPRLAAVGVDAAHRHELVEEEPIELLGGDLVNPFEVMTRVEIERYTADVPDPTTCDVTVWDYFPDR